jgi:ribulose-5-phosphate 4-epimerase/fuculose-1-phosphate aldolase
MKVSLANAPDVRSKIPADEWAVRVELAACYRLVAHFGMTDLIYTHISARIPGTGDRFLINPYGQLFNEITASSLVRVDQQGRILESEDAEVNEAGFTIHSAVHGARHDAACVIHTHTTAGMAISAQKAGLLPLTQHSMRFYGRIGYHDYEGIALDLDERERLVRDLGEHPALILRNHGLLVVGRTVPEAWQNIYYLERACQSQLAASSGGGALNLIPEHIARHTAEQWVKFIQQPGGQRDWPALMRFLDGIDPSYKN